MFSMAAIILLISSEELEIFPIATLSCLTYSILTPSWLPACSTNWPASSVAWAVRLAIPEMLLMVAESSCTELACSVAPWARAWAPLDTCSAL